MGFVKPMTMEIHVSKCVGFFGGGTKVPAKQDAY